MFDIDSIPPIASSASGIYYAYEHCDFVGKLICYMLFAGSTLTWTIMIEKGIALYRAKKASEEFIQLFRGKKFFLSIIRMSENNPGPVARVFDDGVEKLLEFYKLSPERAELYGSAQCPQQKLSSAQVETLRTTMERTVADQILLLEDKIGLLATAVSVSPFFGLFGTVWGITMAFCALAIAGRADMQALAPGIGGALLTTIVGLCVAIPSLIGYNLLTVAIRKITVYMDNFVEEFMARIKLEQYEQE
ncbi:MAG: hypothetical protein A2X49_05940 [Lentisphaerae bacterium GWF2_52_8]|nr:MAG: hypothetical protein A2X49_05940 [Lentisphaerae bacterium GWF2_52_8]